jgi:hypothetical protein
VILCCALKYSKLLKTASAIIAAVKTLRSKSNFAVKIVLLRPALRSKLRLKGSLCGQNNGQIAVKRGQKWAKRRSTEQLSGQKHGKNDQNFAVKT